MTAPSPDAPAIRDLRQLLTDFLDAGIAAAHPSKCLVGQLPPPVPGRLIILGAGKAGGSPDRSMSRASEKRRSDQ